MQTGKVIKHIVSWLKAYCDDADLKGFVVGVSGGIDSAVTSTLCARTEKQVILLSMPIYQDPGQLSLAQQHIEWLEQNHGQATMANTRSRMRMVTLYAFSTHHRMLVVGTGNKVEDFGVGFYTKYGDGGVDILPIADLTKSEIYAIGSELGIGKEIMDASPTDGLWDDNRTDERQIGATYAELEWAMQFEVESGDDGQLDSRQKEVLSIYRRFRQANRHKMDPIPVCKIPEAMR
ncbi:MAG: NAD(+) synthase [Deltaproteobacteria bacterium]|nr:NAD(+) synthase [Deltaproteobacteria bacterium]